MIDKIQIICGDFDESIRGLSDESAGRLFKALIDFAEDRDTFDSLKDDSVASVLFPVMKQHIIRNEEYRKIKSESGKKGGSVSKPKQTKANDKQNEAKAKQKQAPNLTLPNLTNNNIQTVIKPNQCTAGMVVQNYDFKELERKKVKN